MSGPLVLTALLLQFASATQWQTRRGSLSAELQHVVTDDQVLKSSSTLFSDLWAELIIDEADKPVNFDKSDKAVKDTFVADCVVTLDCHESAKENVGDVVKNMCVKVGGKVPECMAMNKTFQAARKDKKLEPWCKKTFDFFAEKTKPKCLAKCPAFMCKQRCDVQVQISDVSDEISAYKIKMDTLASKEGRLKKLEEVQKAYVARIEKLDKTKCIPAGEEAKKLEASQKALGKELGELRKAASKAADDKDKAFEALKKLRADKKAKKGDVAKAEADYKKAAGGFEAAESKKNAKNKSAIEMQGKVTEAQTAKKMQCKRVQAMKDEYKASNKASDELKKLDVEKKKLKTDMDKKVAKKTALETSLKAGLKAA